jgi:glycosyltransferase involved in cell wall biosynthesis
MSESFPAKPQAKVAMVVPCYNESSRWNHPYWEELVNIKNVDWYFINDGSRDNTHAIISQYIKYPNCQVISLHKNSGKSEAVRSGLSMAANNQDTYEFIGFIDADGCVSASDVQRISELPYRLMSDSVKFEAIWASRIPLSGRLIIRSKPRHVIGRILAKVFRMGAGELPYDTQCGFKIFNNSIFLRRSLLREFQTRWLFDLEIHSRLRTEKGLEPVIWEEPLNQWIEVGNSKINFKEGIRILFEIGLLKSLQVKSKLGTRRKWI